MLWMMATSNRSFLMDKLKLLKENAPQGVSRNKKHIPTLTCMVCLEKETGWAFSWDLICD